MSKVLIFLMFTIYFFYMAFKNYKKMEENCDDKEQLLFVWTSAFTMSIVVGIEQFSLAFEALVELLGGA